MNVRKKHMDSIEIIDIIPALYGLIGKVALASSFAFMRAQEFSISTTFVKRNHSR